MDEIETRAWMYVAKLWPYCNHNEVVAGQTVGELRHAAEKYFLAGAAAYRDSLLKVGVDGRKFWLDHLSYEDKSWLCYEVMPDDKENYKGWTLLLEAQPTLAKIQQLREQNERLQDDYDECMSERTQYKNRIQQLEEQLNRPSIPFEDLVKPYTDLIQQLREKLKVICGDEDTANLISRAHFYETQNKQQAERIKQLEAELGKRGEK